MPENSPLFSVIVPVYNTESYIESCINSIIAQDNNSFEIIAVDDGSTDRSRQILDGIASRDSRLRVFFKENGGQGSARNFALTKARGLYVAFVDSDDIIDSRMLSFAYELLSKEDIDVVSFCIEFKDSDDNTVAVRGPKRNFSSEGDIVFLDAMLDHNFISSACNKVYRLNLLRDHNVRFPELLAYEDSVFSRHVALHARKVVYLAQPLYRALTRSGSTSRGMNEASFTRAAEMLELERNLFRDQFADPSLATAFRAHVAHFLAYLTVLAAFRIDDRDVRASCRRIADEAGFRDCAGDRQAIALLDAKARAQIFLARHPMLLRSAALVARRLGRVPY